MTNRRSLLILALASLLAIAVWSGSCSKIKGALGVKTSVSESSDDTPEGVIHAALVAGADADVERGWRAFRKLLHSEERNTIALRDWERLRYPRMRKKIDLFLTSRDPITYEYSRIQERDNGAMKVFVVNSGNPDNPTPCHVKRDPKQSDRWRITNCSL